MEISNFLSNAFDQMVEGILFIDTNGIVQYANSAYLNYIKVSREEFYGKKLRDYRPNAQLPSVVQSGKRILHAQRLEGLEEAYFVNMYPIYENNKITGGLSVITFMNEAQKARLELNNFEEKNKQLLKKINQQSKKYTFDSITAVSKASINTKEYVKRLAQGDMTLLIEGESGTGKEVYAQAIHNASSRKNGVFLAVNCAGFSKDLLESELFGYSEGAFTGAKKGGKIGLFEAANKGTLFLDEISEMDISVQAKFLRALQEKKIRPIGSNSEYDVDIRIICACNVNLNEKVEQGLFRKDLYYRLNAFLIQLLPLKDRKEDIEALSNTILYEINEKYKKNITISKEAMKTLSNYIWPGNIRELKNVIEFSAWICTENTITINDLPQQIRSSTENVDIDYNAEISLDEKIKEFEKNEINKLLKKYGNTVDGKKKVAKILNISLASLYNKLKS